MSRNTKSSTEIGTDYEQKVLKYIQSLVEEGEMPGASKYTKIFFHPTYYDDVGESVNPDFAIEVYRKSDSETPSNIIVFECKHLSRKIDTSDYNEFQTNISRIRRTGVKGVLVTNIGFPQSVIHRSRGGDTGYSTGIGLIVFNDNGADWIVERYTRSDVSHTTNMNILLGKSSASQPIMFYDSSFFNPIDFFIQLDIPVKNVWQQRPRHYNESDIENIAKSFCKSFPELSGHRLEDILKYIEPNAKIVDSSLSTGVLASYDFKDDILYLSNSLRDNPHRRNFSIAHEIGHLVLHKAFLQCYFSDTALECSQQIRPSDEILNKLEVQANQFASHILLPTNIFINELRRRKENLGMNLNKKLYLDRQSQNIRDCRQVFQYLSSYFQVSIETVKIRLQKLNELVVDSSVDPQHISELL